MTNASLTHILFILDRSGSMESIRADTIGGFNAFLAGQRETAGRCTMTLVQFDHEYEERFCGLPIEQVRSLDTASFIPRGSTALLDAIGRALIQEGERLSATPEEQRPGLVICAILTDGEENASTEFSAAKIRQMLSHQREVYGWQVIFLGANQDAFAVADSLGIQRTHASSFSADAIGVGTSFKSTSDLASRMRKSTAMGRSAAEEAFSEEERDAMINTPPPPPRRRR
ncbi:MAG: VWA domain-containing protein [Deltaproteobacteria bacterium]|nr:VWA domain-containing protein [Deltaproteobacteria bacterium]